MAETEKSLQEMVRRKAGQRSAQIAAVLKPFVEQPGSLTCLNAEKELHELTRSLADDIFAEVMQRVARDPAFIAAAVRKAAEKGGAASTTGGAPPRSSSEAGKP